MNVTLIAFTPESEKVVAAAAKLCYSHSGAQDIMKDLDVQNTERFIDKLMDLGHASPLEHISFTFAVEGVSRVLTHQLVRHRIASYSQQSQRYVKLDQFEYIVPPAIERNEIALELFRNAMREDQKTYDALVSTLEASYKEENVKKGHPEKKAKAMAEKAAIEDARFVFPNACETKIVVTMNARSLINFFQHRCCNRAQWEIRAMADEMLRLVRAVTPNVFGEIGPRCIGGPCPEGSMTCGEILKVREKYAAL